MKAGKPYTPKKHGFWVSEFYLIEIMDAKVEQIKK